MFFEVKHGSNMENELGEQRQEALAGVISRQLSADKPLAHRLEHQLSKGSNTLLDRTCT